MIYIASADTVEYRVRVARVAKRDLRNSWSESLRRTVPSWRALILEWVFVEPARRRQGVFTRFLNLVTAETGYDLFIVEAVQNPHLAEALTRWGWDCDRAVMDFYLFAGKVKSR